MSTYPDERITGFIRKHHVMTLATVSENGPWCSNCFYAYSETENFFVFTSDEETRHVQEFNINKQVAASVVLETKVIGKIQGIQLTGTIEKPEGDLLERCRKRYLKRFPYAVLMQTTLWILRPEHIKMTDNRLGFGKKLKWNRD